MYKAVVATSRWERERRQGCKVELTIRPLSVFIERERMESLRQFGMAWQSKMNECGIECTNSQLVPSDHPTSNCIIRMVAIMKFDLPVGYEFYCPTVWFSLTLV